MDEQDMGHRNTGQNGKNRTDGIFKGLISIHKKILKLKQKYYHEDNLSN